MKPATLALLVCVTAPVALGAREQVDSKVTPIQKVIEMLNGMMVKAKKEKEDEQVRFAKFKTFCDHTIADKEKAIAEADAAIEQLEADIAKAEADVEQLSKEIDELDKSINGWETDEKEATNVRETENADYEKVHTDYAESIDAITRAIGILKARSADIPQAELIALSHVASKSSLFPVQVRQALVSYLQSATDSQAALHAPEANAYEFQSGGIITMLKKLKSKFEDEMFAVEKEEMNSKHMYEVLMESLHNSIEEAKASRDSKNAFRARRKEDAAKAKGDLEDTTKMRAEDEKYMTELKVLCTQKAKDFESRQTLRQEEIEAIAKAIEIISSPSVSGMGEKHLPAALLQVHPHQHASLAQLRSNLQSPSQQKAASFLSEQAAKSKSQLLSMIAQRVSDDPFGKVKKMIKDLIVKLMEQASQEADHKGWCDSELSANKKTRDELSATIEDLTAQCDNLNATAIKLGEEITDLSDQIAAIDAAVAKATNERQEEKAKNTETIADAKEASEAVAQALKVLKDFYAKAEGATALIQRKKGPADDVPETFDEPYQGNQAASGGVVGMLEVIASDFARLESDTTSAEAAAAKEYETFIKDSKEDKEMKHKERFEKELKKQEAEGELGYRKEDLETAQEELTVAMEYYDKLKPSCVDLGLSYEDRVARRKEEIVSLQEALKILSGDIR